MANYSLSALKYFVTVAACGSFTDAARVLGVTQGAVSRRVQLFEEEIGVVLFCRHDREKFLTDAGKELYLSTQSSLDNIYESINRITHETTQPRAFRLGVMPSLASKWLIPQMASFHEAHSHININIVADNHINAERVFTQSIELSIILAEQGQITHHGFAYELLMHDSLVPVCSARYLDDAPPLRVPQDLSQHILLHDETEIGSGRGLDWDNWAQKKKIQLASPYVGRLFNQSDHVLQAAVCGQGVALSRYSIAARELQKGRLLEPLGVRRVRTDTSYYMCALQEHWTKKNTLKVRRWLKELAKKL